jgi:hypothetical protein
LAGTMPAIRKSAYPLISVFAREKILEQARAEIAV